MVAVLKKNDCIEVGCPADVNYIPAVRGFLADIVLANDFTRKYAFRTEVVVDEVYNNAIAYGSPKIDSQIEFSLDVFEDRCVIGVKDEGGEEDDVRKLSDMLDQSIKSTRIKDVHKGLDVVKLLADSVDFIHDNNSLTKINIVRYKEELA